MGARGLGVPGAGGRSSHGLGFGCSARAAHMFSFLSYEPVARGWNPGSTVPCQWAVFSTDTLPTASRLCSTGEGDSLGHASDPAYSTGRREHHGRRAFVSSVMGPQSVIFLLAHFSDLASKDDYVNPGVLPHRMLSDVGCTKTACLLGDKRQTVSWSKAAESMVVWGLSQHG